MLDNAPMHHLTAYGWNDHFAGQLAPDESLQHVGRVVQEHREAYLVRAAGAGMGNIWAEISGKLRHESSVRADFPAVGDWVILRGLQHAHEQHEDAIRPETGGPVHITRILPRRTVVTRRLEGKREGGGATGDQQVLAVNVDMAFLGTSLNENFSLRRLERYLALAHDAGVRPIILLTKSDLCSDSAPFIEQVQTIAGPEVAIHATSAVSGQGLDLLRGYLQPGTTAVILGSSGIGKSTLVNHLAEADVQDMMEAREFDDKGRHCTTFRHLVRTACGGLIIDTPGLRGISLGEATDALAATFSDIEVLAAGCRFRECAHDTEPGCALKTAVENGTLAPTRLEGYLRLQREQQAAAQRENRIADRKQKKLEKIAAAAQQKKHRRNWDM
jgi:ribosome biogenesis GTPase / thiamine phosphate phosphatase